MSCGVPAGIMHGAVAAKARDRGQMVEDRGQILTSVVVARAGGSSAGSSLTTRAPKQPELTWVMAGAGQNSSV